MKSCIKILTLVLFPFLIYGQDVPESLRQALKTATTDSAKCSTLISLYAYYVEDNADSSLKYAQQALLIARRNNRKINESRCLSDVAVSLARLSKYIESFEAFEEALKIAEDPNDESSAWKDDRFSFHQNSVDNQALLHVLIGFNRGFADSTDEQILHFRKALQLAEEVKDTALTGAASWGLALCYQSQGKLDSALTLVNTTEKIYQTNDINSYLADVYLTKGDIYSAKGDKSKQLYYIHKSLEVLVLEERNNTGALSWAYGDLTNYYLQEKQKDSSLYYAKKNVELLLSRLSKDMRWAYFLLSKSYELRNETDSAYKYQGLALTAVDSLDAANAKNLSDFQKQSFKNQMRVRALEQEKTSYQSKIRTNILSGGLFTVLVIAFLLFRNNRQKQKAYTLLQKQKEEIDKQKKEAEIEASLERVRAATMGMQKQDDLLDVTDLFAEQLIYLGFDLEVVNFSDGLSYGDWDLWITVPLSATTKSTDRAFIPWFNHPYFQKTKTGLDNFFQTGNDLNIAVFNQEEKDSFLDYIYTNTMYKDFPAETKTLMYSKPGFTFSAIYLKETWVSICKYDTTPFTDEQHIILRRFAQAFGQAYTRFLDLQKAEAQAREAEIQLGLERVRAVTMAMKHHDDLLKVTDVFYEQLVRLGFDLHLAHFRNGRQQDDWDLWFTYCVIGDTPTSRRMIIPRSDVYLMQRTEELIALYQNGGGDLAVDVFNKEEKDSFYKHVYAGPDFVDIPSEEKQYVFDAPGYVYSAVFLPNTWVALGRYNTVPFTDEQNKILRRFAQAFGQAYTRFLDLEKAEAQARESEIQLALERVRARTMAMQKKDDLLSVLDLLVEQFIKLGVPVEVANFSDGIPEGDWNLWVLTPTGKGTTSTDYIHFPQIDHPYFRNMKRSLEIYKTGGSDLSKEIFSKEDKDTFSDYIFSQTKYKDIMPPEGKELIYSAPGFLWSLIFLKDTWVSINKYNTTPFTDEEDALLRRFANAFSLAYTRFLDLQKAEGQAKEAIKQAALDRIRGDIASMRTVNDLDKITPLIWNELTTLGISFIRCGVFIMDESQQLIHTFLSTPEGKAIAAFHLPFDTSENFSEIVHHWRNKKTYVSHWTEKDFTAIAETLVRQRAIERKEQYLNTLPHSGFYLHFLPFLQGMLYVGNTTELNEEDIKLIEAIAETFSTAYARYEDFNKLELAKQQIEKTFSELKSTQAQLIQAEKMASLGELTAGIAHEIQNPLNFVNNFSEVNKELAEELKTELLADNKEEAISIAYIILDNEEKINHHGKRADAIVKGMLQHSRTASGKKETTDINSLCDEYLRLSYHGLRARDKDFNADFKTDFDESVGKINVVPQDIGRVLLNLFNNAFYAVNEKKKTADESYQSIVSIQTKKLNDKIEITVTDNGNGIPQNIIDKIFQPFFTTKPTGQGTGLGLSLSYDIIKAHGGEIKVETKHGEGSEFIIILRV